MSGAQLRILASRLAADHHRTNPGVSARGPGRPIQPWETSALWRENKRYFALRWRRFGALCDLQTAAVCRDNERDCG